MLLATKLTLHLVPRRAPPVAQRVRRPGSARVVQRITLSVRHLGQAQTDRIGWMNETAVRGWADQGTDLLADGSF